MLDIARILKSSSEGEDFFQILEKDNKYSYLLNILSRLK